jgi:hypothetical protein
MPNLESTVIRSGASFGSRSQPWQAVEVHWLPCSNRPHWETLTLTTTGG